MKRQFIQTVSAAIRGVSLPAAAVRKVVEAGTIPITSLSGMSQSSEVRIAGIFAISKEIKTGKGDSMAFAVLKDEEGFVEVVVLPEIFKEFSHLLSGGVPVLVTGVLEFGEIGDESIEQKDKARIIATEIGRSNER